MPIDVVTNDRSRNPASAAPARRAWRAVALAAIPVGVAVALAGLLLNGYWPIVGGMTLAALGAYEYVYR